MNQTVREDLVGVCQWFHNLKFIPCTHFSSVSAIGVYKGGLKFEQHMSRLANCSARWQKQRIDLEERESQASETKVSTEILCSCPHGV